MAALPTLAADPVAPLVGAFRRRYPGIRIDLAAPEDTGELFDLVVSGSCELGVTDAHDIPATLVSHSLGRQSLVLSLPPGSAHADGATLDLSSLEATPFLVAPRGTSTFRLLEEGFAAAGRSPTVAVVTAQRDAILPLVIAGAGAALVPESVWPAPRRGWVRSPHARSRPSRARPRPPRRPALTGRHPLHRRRRSRR